MVTPEQPHRRRLVPLWAIVAPAALLLAGVGLIVYLVVTRENTSVSTPNITNLDVAVARSRLAEQGLLLKRGDKRFSPVVPVDGVIDQSPQPGTRVARGSYVTVVISAGSESFPMPDVSGLPLSSAREMLQAKGLIVQTEVVASARPKNTVVSSTPGTGVTVSSSDMIRLAISSGSAGSTAVQPADLSNRVFIIDPVLPSAGETDTAMELERRLYSLLEASGAKVYATRSVTDTGTTASLEARAARAAQAASATAVIGIDVREKGVGGITLTTMQSLKVPSAAYLGSVQLSKALVPPLNALVSGVRASESASDAVLQQAAVPGVRISLGSRADGKDAARLADPLWADRVAGAIYVALSNVYGSK